MGVHRRISCAALVLCVCLASGCSPTPSPSSWPTASGSGSETTNPSAPTPSPSPSSTLSANQVAAVAALNGYTRVSNEIGADPSRFSAAEMTKTLSKYVGGDMVEASTSDFMRLKGQRYRVLGLIRLKSTEVGRDHDTGDSRGIEVVVTACQDQTEVRVVDKSGNVVEAEQRSIPDFLLRQYSILKPEGTTQWRIYGMETVKGACG